MADVTLEGRLYPFADQGSEGTVLLVFIENGREDSGYGLHPLANGDRLTVYADAARTITRWQGNIWLGNLIDEDQPPGAWFAMFADQAPARLTFPADLAYETYEGLLDKRLIPDMQAPYWVLKPVNRREETLGNTDHLTVYTDESRSNILWEGNLEFGDVHQCMACVFPPKGKTTTPDDIRAHVFPKNVPPDLWEDMITTKRPARLVRSYWERRPDSRDHG